jgi:hypothetical protein
VYTVSCYKDSFWATIVRCAQSIIRPYGACILVGALIITPTRLTGVHHSDILERPSCLPLQGWVALSTSLESSSRKSALRIPCPPLVTGTLRYDAPPWFFSYANKRSVQTVFPPSAALRIWLLSCQSTSLRLFLTLFQSFRLRLFVRYATTRDSQHIF